MQSESFIAGFSHLGVYVCRIVVPGMSEIDPIDELEWKNSGVANGLSAAILHLHELDDEACGKWHGNCAQA